MNDVIGIIDRGVGGLGVYKLLKEARNRSIIYFADNGYTPYGLVEKNQLKQRLDRIISHLEHRGVNKIVLACNSASAVYPDTDNVKGIIPFGVSSLLKAKPRKPGLIATAGTIRSAIYKNLFKHHELDVIERSAQAFAILIENGVVSGEQIEKAAREIMPPLAKCDSILLACTHFPAIIPLLENHVVENCEFIDPANDMVSWINEYWPITCQHPKSQSVFVVTGSTRQFIKSAKLSFDVTINASTVNTLELSAGRRANLTS